MRTTVVLAAAFVALTAAPSAAQRPGSSGGAGWFQKPELSLDLLDWTTPALRLTVDWGDSIVSRPIKWAFQVDAPFALDADDNPETVQAALSLTALILDLSGTDLTGEPGEEEPSRGAARLGVQLGAESSQRFDDADVAGGLTLVYDHASPTFWYAPAIDLAWDLVQCVGCEVPAPDDDDRYHKVDLKLDWSIRLDNFSQALEGFRVRPSARLFKAWGIGPGLDAIRDDEGLWGQAALARHFARGILHEVYAGWRAGQLPVRLQEEDAWFLGATLVF